MRDEDFKGRLGTPENIAGFVQMILELCIVLGEVRKALTANAPRWFIFAPLYPQAILDSAHTITLLLEHRKRRDALIIARTVLETTINFGFIAAEGPPSHQRAIQHSVQKKYRNTFRGFRGPVQNLNVGWLDAIPSPESEVIANALKSFSRKDGRELTSWTKESLLERVEKIGAWLSPVHAEDLRYAMFCIFEDASETSHGTLHSLLRAAGLGCAPADSEMAVMSEIGLQVCSCMHVAAVIGARLVADKTLETFAKDVFMQLLKMECAEEAKENADKIFYMPLSASPPSAASDEDRR